MARTVPTDADKLATLTSLLSLMSSWAITGAMLGFG